MATEQQRWARALVRARLRPEPRADGEEEEEKERTGGFSAEKDRSDSPFPVMPGRGALGDVRKAMPRRIGPSQLLVHLWSSPLQGAALRPIRNRIQHFYKQHQQVGIKNKPVSSCLRALPSPGAAGEGIYLGDGVAQSETCCRTSWAVRAFVFPGAGTRRRQGNRLEGSSAWSLILQGLQSPFQLRTWLASEQCSQ